MAEESKQMVEPAENTAASVEPAEGAQAADDGKMDRPTPDGPETLAGELPEPEKAPDPDEPEKTDEKPATEAAGAVFSEKKLVTLLGRDRGTVRRKRQEKLEEGTDWTTRDGQVLLTARGVTVLIAELAKGPIAEDGWEQRLLADAKAEQTALTLPGGTVENAAAIATGDFEAGAEEAAEAEEKRQEQVEAGAAPTPPQRPDVTRRREQERKNLDRCAKMLTGGMEKEEIVEILGVPVVFVEMVAQELREQAPAQQEALGAADAPAIPQRALPQAESGALPQETAPPPPLDEPAAPLAPPGGWEYRGEVAPALMSRARQYKARQPEEYWDCVERLRQGMPLEMVGRLYSLDEGIRSGVYALAQEEAGHAPTGVLVARPDAPQEQIVVLARARNKRLLMGRRDDGTTVRVQVENNEAHNPNDVLLCVHVRADLWQKVKAPRA